MIVLSWINFHPAHCPEDIAKRLRAAEIERLSADFVAAGFIEPTTWH